MNTVFYISSVVGVIATVAAITGFNAVHSLLYLIVSLLAVALIFFTLGAPVIAALEVIIYAGAIIVLFLIVVMIFNPGIEAVQREKGWLGRGMWLGPAFLAAVLVAEMVYILFRNVSVGHPAGAGPIEPAALGAALFGPYLLTVELASLVLLAGLIGAYHLGRRHDTEETRQEQHREQETETEEQRELTDMGLPR
jgi:NADH-quinone oxidoreductase subunit J